MITRTSTLPDIAFAIGTALDGAGITAVLTGGSAATFHAPEAYQSRDLDFIVTVWAPRGEVALAAAGFHRDAACYVHALSPYPVEFPKGPLMIGDDHIRSWSTVGRGAEVLHVLTPTDSCRDRLAAFLAWNDFSGLEQALGVCRARADVDLDLVRDWCARMGQRKKWELFAARLGR